MMMAVSSYLEISCGKVLPGGGTPSDDLSVLFQTLGHLGHNNIGPVGSHYYSSFHCLLLSSCDLKIFHCPSCCWLPCCTVFCKLFSIFGVDASLFSVFLEPLCLIFLLRAPHRRLPLGFVNQAYRRHGQTIVVVAKRGPAHAHQSIN